MNVRRQFIFEEDNAGRVGFMPLWISRSANYGVIEESRMFLHDMLEHSMQDTGTITDEVVAYGRCLALRSTAHMGTRTAFAADLGKELAMMLDSINESSAPRRRKLPMCESRLARQEISSDFSIYVRELAQTFAAQMQRGDLMEAFGFESKQECLDYMTGWIKQGYFDVLRRYGDLARVETLGNTLFDSWFVGLMQEQIDEAKEYAFEGMVITVNLDIEREYDPQLRLTAHRNQDAGWIIAARARRAHS